MGKDIEDRVRTILFEHLGVETSKIVPGARIIEDLGADSLDCVELVMAIEEEFSVPISAAQAAAGVTVADLLRLLDGMQVDQEG